MEFNAFEVGKCYTPALGLGEGVRFGINPDGAVLMYGFSNPTADEVKATKSGQDFEIRFVTLNGIIWILSKCGDLAWTDAPYNPRLDSSAPLDPASIGDGEGLLLTLMMLNSDNAVVKSVRAIGLGTDFSRRLLTEVSKVRQQAMTLREASASIQRTMVTYPTNMLVQMAKDGDRYRLPKGR